MAWRLAQAGRALDNGSQHWGSAFSWDNAARRRGSLIGSSAANGTVAQWNAGESSPWYAPGAGASYGSFTAGSAGHVAWVTAVYPDGSALVEQYNVGAGRSYSQMHVRAPRYLHLR